MAQLPQNGLHLGITGISGVGEQHGGVMRGPGRCAHDPFLVNVGYQGGLARGSWLSGECTDPGSPDGR